MRIGYLVENDHDRAAVARDQTVDDIVELDIGERLDLDSPALVLGILRQQRSKLRAIHHCNRRGAANLAGARRRDERRPFFGMRGQHRDPAPAPRRVGERRDDDMAAIKPAPATAGSDVRPLLGGWPL